MGGLDGHRLPGNTWEGLGVPAALVCGVPMCSNYKVLVSMATEVLCAHAVRHWSWTCSGSSAQGQAQGKKWVQGLLFTAKAREEGSVHIGAAVL